MSTRERWIVYPLLFLALGAALRDKLIGKVEIPRLDVQGLARCEAVECGAIDCVECVCHELVVLGPAGKPGVLVGTDARVDNSGFIEIRSPNDPKHLPLVKIGAGRVANGLAGQVLVLGDVGHGIRAPVSQMPPGMVFAPLHGTTPGQRPPRQTAPQKSKPVGHPANQAPQKPSNASPPAASRAK